MISQRGAARRDERPERPVPLDASVVEELAVAVGRRHAVELSERLGHAARYYERDRYREALAGARAVLEHAPESLAARELAGLSCYRLGRWRDAIRFLYPIWVKTGEADQVPVLMDCRRALKQPRQVEALFEELRRSSPGADLLAEARLVLAGTYADRGDLGRAIEVLVQAGAARAMRRPAERHIRQWYALGDLYERSGDIPRARELFRRLVTHAPDLADVPARLEELGGSKLRAPRPAKRRQST